jgi:hypothetical protein
MALSAVSCIQRGVTNLRANWELVVISWLQGFLTAFLVVVGFVPPLGVLGFASFDWLATSEVELSELLSQAGQLMNRGADAWLLLGASLLVSFAIWLAAFLVYCFFQGGIFGVLMAGDRQAPSGRLRGWQWFRTFSGRDLRGWGGLYLWRYFWLLNLMAAIGLLWFLGVAVAFGLTVLGGEQWGATAAIGIGCGSAIPLGFGLILVAVWANLAQVDLAREDSSVGKALRRSLNLVGRRLGAVTLIFLITLVLAIVFGVGVSTLSVVVGLFLPEAGVGSWVGTVVQLGLSGLEMIVGSVVAVGFAAALVSLVRSEATLEQSG